MNRDKLVVILIIFGFVFLSVLSWLPNPEAKDYVRTTFGVVLCLFLYLGHVWSRWVIGVLSALTAVISATGLISSYGNLGVAFILVTMSGFYGYAAFCLLNPKLLKTHFEHENA